MSNKLITMAVQQDNFLLIEFPRIAGSKNHLIISSLKQKVNWCLYVENEEPEVMSYLLEPPISLEFIFDRAECLVWYQVLSKELRDKLVKYPGMGFTLIYHITCYQAAYDLFKTNPTILCILLLEAKKQVWAEEKVITLLNQKQKHILGVCGFPSTKSAVKLLKKLNYKKLDSLAVSRITKLLQLPGFYSLNHYPGLPEELADLLGQFPWMIGSRITQNNINCYDQVIQQLGEIEGYDKYLKEVKMGKKRVYNCKNEEQLTKLHKQLVKRCDHIAYINQLADDNYPPSPVPLPEENWLHPLRGSKALAIEADLMGGNCAFTYDNSIQKGQYYIFKTINPVAMIGLELHENNPPSIDQIELYNNTSADKLEDIHNKMYRWLYQRHKEPYFKRQLDRVHEIQKSSKPFFRKVFDCSQLALDFCTQEQEKKNFISSFGENIEWALRGNPDEDDIGIFLKNDDRKKETLFLNTFDFTIPEQADVEIKTIKDNFTSEDIKALDGLVTKSLQIVEQSLKDYDEIRLKGYISSNWETCLHGLWLQRILDNCR